ncbi:hypothetical protein [Kaistella polysaccharea]|uniref:hypothetical protein n=1 Tax=Kaistella polysaccharea TaxID=2878534 RepID=UPI001CF1934E|nr:hypothetical protein [Kaistella polysaccharea]
MKKEDAEKLSKSKFQKTDNYEQRNQVNYYGEKVDITAYEGYAGENQANTETIQVLSTKSKKFRTKSGMGVGSSRNELINAYKDYANFSVNQDWNEKGPSKTTSYFKLGDLDARTELSFKLVDNIMVEVMIYFNEGC